MIAGIVLLLLLGVHIPLLLAFPTPPRRDKTNCYDVGIILGCPCQPDGSLTDLQKQRMDRAIHLYEQGHIRKLLISGGSVQNPHKEAVVMAAYAQAHGVVAEDIVLETRAANTYENLAYAKPLCDSHAFHSVLVITSRFHLRRSYFFVRKFFPHAVMEGALKHVTLAQRSQEYVRMWNTLYYERKYKKKDFS